MKSRYCVLAITLIAVVCALLTASPVLAQAGPDPAPNPSMQPSWDTVFEAVFTDTFLKQLITLLGLILLQVILAVALALKTSTFQWRKLADFYKALVLPYVLGWLALTFAVNLVSADLVGVYSVLIGAGVPSAAWMILVVSLGARIVTTVKSLYGNLMPFTPPGSDGDSSATEWRS